MIDDIMIITAGPGGCGCDIGLRHDGGGCPHEAELHSRQRGTESQGKEKGMGIVTIVTKTITIVINIERMFSIISSSN